MNSMKWLMAGAMLIFGSIGLFARRRRRFLSLDRCEDRWRSVVAAHPR